MATQLTKITHPPLGAGGTVVYHVKGLGLVGDYREFNGSHFTGRRWIAVHKPDLTARSATANAPGLKTRAAAVAWLTEQAV